MNSRGRSKQGIFLVFNCLRSRTCEDEREAWLSKEVQETGLQQEVQKTVLSEEVEDAGRQEAEVVAGGVAEDACGSKKEKDNYL